MSIVVVPMAIFEGPREVARWHEAAAIEKYFADDYSAALVHLDKGLSYDSRNLSIYALRAQWKTEREDYQGALNDFNQALEVVPNHSGVLLLRSQVNHHLGQHDQAIADVKSAFQTASQSAALIDPQQLNTLAYSRAIGGTECGPGSCGHQQGHSGR